MHAIESNMRKNSSVTKIIVIEYDPHVAFDSDH